MGSSNIERLRAGHDAFSVKDFQKAATLVAQECTIVDHGKGATLRSRDEFLGWMEQFTVGSSDIRIVDAQYIDGGEWVTARFRAVGKQDGPLGTFPPSNLPFSLDVCEVWRFDSDGNAVEGHNYSDTLGLLIQLGHIQPAAEVEG
jgi:hypothetical protein